MTAEETIRHYDEAARDWTREVDTEAARLITLGVPPWDAIIRARQRVSERRRTEAEAHQRPTRTP